MTLYHYKENKNDSKGGHVCKHRKQWSERCSFDDDVIISEETGKVSVAIREITPYELSSNGRLVAVLSPERQLIEV